MVSSSATFSNPLTTSKTSNTPKNTGRAHTSETCQGRYAQCAFYGGVVFMMKAKTVRVIHCLFLFLLPRLTLGALGLKLNDYWREVTEKRAREREFQALDRDNSEDDPDDVE